MDVSDNQSADLSKKRKLEEENGVVLPPELVTSTTTTLSFEDLCKVIEPFTHEQLSKIVLTASLRHLDILDAVRSIADQDHTQRKLFVRGLGWDTTSEKLCAIFFSYGDLVEASVVLDKVTGITKGYGFINYKHIDGALLALKEPSKKIDGRMTITTLASAGLTNGNVVNPQTLIDVSLRKIVIRNVPCDMSEEKLLDHFSSYGEVEEGPLGFDLATGKSKGFAFIIYRTVEGAKASVVNPIKSIDGHQVNCKLANSGYKTKNPSGTPAAPQVQGSGDWGKPEPEVVNLNQQSSV